MIAVAPFPTTEKSEVIRRRWRIRGIVQGVGFRPWVCLTATRLGLAGEVGNDTSGVWIEAEGTPGDLLLLAEKLRHAPEPARVESVLEEDLGASCQERSSFRIATSCLEGEGGAVLTPDLAPCVECRRELFDPLDRRYLYPFLTCARCGPRYTVTRSLPYDRTRTSLAEFPLCPDCAAEYADPHDRRFHAETIACPRCGPRLRALAPDGSSIAVGNAATDAAVAILEAGKILAVQAVGGFQLWADATRSESVARLRELKHRDAKPLAVMVRDIEEAKEFALLTQLEEQLLTNSVAPIVLVKPRPGSLLAPEIASGCATVGLCLPASPLQLLLRVKFNRPVIATSGNLSDEPICHQPSEAMVRLCKVADLLLVHDREIVQPADDSVVRIMAGRVRVIRRARGYASAPVRMPLEVERPGLAVGGQVKGALALVRGRGLVLSPHLGDQDTVLARQRHADTAIALQRLLRLRPAWVACDSHPDYATSVNARRLALPRLEVQHHHAHLLAVLAEQKSMPSGPVLGVIWDGSGHGPDGTVWGGEFLLARGASCRRVGYLRRFALPGGESAVREPRRSAFAWLWETLGPQAANEAARRFDLTAGVMGKLCDGAAGTLRTSSAGRLFDAVAALAGLCPVARYEGEAAMLLEAAAATHPERAEPYPFSIRPNVAAISNNVQLVGDCEGWALDTPDLPDIPTWEVDTEPLAKAVWQAVCAGVGAPEIAARFHQTLVAITVEVAKRVGISTVVLGGGCFQNALLLENVEAALSGAGHEVWIPEQFPANDGGLAAGQAFAGAWLHPSKE